MTRPVLAQPPDDPNADSFGRGPWHINADRTVWVPAEFWLAGEEGNKVLWIRPAGTKLQITGRRLDANAAPLRVDIPCCYPTGFQVTGVTFPTAGCWEVTAKAGSSMLKFVTRVYSSRSYNEAP